MPENDSDNDFSASLSQYISSVIEESHQRSPSLVDALRDISGLSTDEILSELQSKENAVRIETARANKEALQAQECSQRLKERTEEHDLRKRYLDLTFKFVVWVTVAALFLTLMDGIGSIDLSDSVVITLLTTTIANVLGCLLIAFHWLFPNRQKKSK